MMDPELNPYAPPAHATSATNVPREGDNRTFSAPVLITLSVAIGAISCVSVLFRSPSELSPLPMIVLLPLLLGIPLPLIAVAASGLFGLSHIRHFTNNPRPKPGVGFTIALAIVTGLTALAVIGGWPYGIRYQGTTYTVVVSLINAVFAVLGWITWWLSRRPGRYRMQVVFGFSLFTWLFWFACPHMGELP